MASSTSLSEGAPDAINVKAEFVEDLLIALAHQDVRDDQGLEDDLRGR